MMKSLKTQFIGAIAMVLVAAIAMGSSTYAWFAMNTKVAVTGMEVRTKVSDNLLIAPSTTTQTAKESDSSFRTNYLAHSETLLEPVSSINGSDFYYTRTNNVGANGDARDEVYVAYVEGDTFDQNYGVDDTDDTADAKGYVDYAFQLKADNSSDAAKYVNLKTVELLYNGAATTEKAFRIAVFVDDMGATGATAAKNPDDATPANRSPLRTILRPESAVYFTTESSVPKALASTSTLDSVTNIDALAQIGTVAAKSSNYWKVVVRLWIEGEDETCINTTFANLTKDWALNLSIELEDSAMTGPKSYINKNNDATSVDLSSGVTVDKSDSKKITIDGVVYGELSVVMGSSTKLYCSDNTITSASRIYTYDGLGYLTDVTNQCTLP